MNSKSDHSRMPTASANSIGGGNPPAPAGLFSKPRNHAEEIELARAWFAQQSEVTSNA